MRFAWRRGLGEALELGVVVDQAKCDGRAGGHAVKHARFDDDSIRFQLLSLPSAVAPLSALELEWFDTWLLGEHTPLATTATLASDLYSKPFVLLIVALVVLVVGAHLCFEGYRGRNK